MAIDTAAGRTAAAGGYAGVALFAGLYTAMGAAGVAGTEVSGGSPAYARKAVSWTNTGGVLTASVTFDVPTGVTVVGCGLYSAATAGTYYDKATVTSQAFASQGTYVLSLTFTES